MGGRATRERRVGSEARGSLTTADVDDQDKPPREVARESAHKSMVEGSLGIDAAPGKLEVRDRDGEQQFFFPPSYVYPPSNLIENGGHSCHLFQRANTSR